TQFLHELAGLGLTRCTMALTRTHGAETPAMSFCLRSPCRCSLFTQHGMHLQLLFAGSLGSDWNRVLLWCWRLCLPELLSEECLCNVQRLLESTVSLFVSSG